jgi:SAM-dependent methyltransferase
MVDANDAEYADAERYDIENASFEPDGPFYLELARRIGGRVLELGCGTGRITLPLAAAGIEIAGLDRAPAMLTRAMEKEGASAVRWVEADARSFRLPGQFRLIFESGATFQHMLDRGAQEAFLGMVRQHLETDGRFVVSSIVPTLDLMTDVPVEEEWLRYTDRNGRLVRVSGTQHYDPLSQIKTETAHRRWYDTSGREVTTVAPLRLRYTFPQEMQALLHYNDFEILHRFGGPDFSDLVAGSSHQIYICRATTSAIGRTSRGSPRTGPPGARGVRSGTARAPRRERAASRPRRHVA